MKLDLKGLVPATFTPMHNNGEINLDVIEQYADYLQKENISNVFVLGSSGEGCSLSLDERKRVAEKWMSASENKVKNVIVHVGTQSLVDTKTLAKHAESIGAFAIATIPSFYFKPKSVKHLAIYLAEVAKAAPNTPMMYYHIPSITGVSFKVKAVIDELEKIGVPNFAGVKFTGYDLCDFGRCIECYGEKYSMCYGWDEFVEPNYGYLNHLVQISKYIGKNKQLISGLLMGAQSGVGSTYNYATKLNQRIYDACMRKDVQAATAEQFKSQKYLSFLFTVDFDLAMGKALMTRITGIDVGPPRLPLLPVPQEEMDKIIEELTKLGFFQWIK